MTFRIVGTIRHGRKCVICVATVPSDCGAMRHAHLPACPSSYKPVPASSNRRARSRYSGRRILEAKAPRIKFDQISLRLVLHLSGRSTNPHVFVSWWFVCVHNTRAHIGFDPGLPLSFSFLRAEASRAFFDASN